MMRSLLATTGLLCFLGACAGGSGLPALEIALGAAEVGAKSYVTLPACGSSASKLCSDPAVSAQIKAADAGAYSAIKSAEAQAAAGASPDLTAATAALQALQNILATLPQE